MYAVIEIGAKQFLVRKDDVIDVEKQDCNKDDKISIEKVLLISDDKTVNVGKPYIQGASVDALVVAQTKGKKAISFKYRRRKSSHWTKGHRQKLTRLKITGIKG